MTVVQPHEPPSDAVPLDVRITRTQSTTTAVPETQPADLEAGGKGVNEKVPPTEPPSPVVDEFLVTLKGREHISAQSWSAKYRWFITALSGLLVLNATFASSAPANLVPAFMETFHVSEEVGILTISGCVTSCHDLSDSDDADVVAVTGYMALDDFLGRLLRGHLLSYVRMHKELAPAPVPPEKRLESMLFAAPAFAVALFWLGWTSYPSISIASPILAVCLIGFTTLSIFLGCLTYIVDCYLWNAASGLAINTVMRSGFGAFFSRQNSPEEQTYVECPLTSCFTQVLDFLYSQTRVSGGRPSTQDTYVTDLPLGLPVYAKLSTPGATSLLAGLAVLFIPGPFLLMKYGKRIRGMSKNAVVRHNE
ncbi:hypothetical protein P7C70_g842, partial [Phenoliferia sp. Uapishka_3]